MIKQPSLLNTNTTMSYSMEHVAHILGSCQKSSKALWLATQHCSMAIYVQITSFGVGVGVDNRLVYGSVTDRLLVALGDT